MGQQVVYIQNNLDGLRLKGVGSFAQGAKWPVDNVPEALIEKMKNGDSFVNAKGSKVPVASCFAADGSEVDLSNAYMPRFNIGQPPVPAVIHESSSKPRHVVSPLEEENNTEGDLSEEDNTEGDLEESEDVSGKKKKKKKKSL